MTEQATQKGGQVKDTQLSVIVFARENTSQDFCGLMDSLLDQKTDSIEVFVLDMNEPGDPFSLSLQEDLQRYPIAHMRPFMQRMTLAGIRNVMLEEVTGEYLAVVSGSDRWNQEKAALQIKAIQAKENCAVCCCNGIVRLDQSGLREMQLFDDLPTDEKAWLMADRKPTLSQFLFHIPSLRRIGGFDPALNDQNSIDLDVMLRADHCRNVAYIRDCLFSCLPAPMNREEAEKNYENARKIYYKNYDFMLRHRDVFASYQFKLMKLSFASGLFAQCAVHGLLVFLKRPVHAAAAGVKRLSSLLSHTLHQAVNRARLEGVMRSIRRSVMLMRRNGVMPEPTAPTSPVYYAPEGQKEKPDQIWRQPLGMSFQKDLKSITIPHYVSAIPYGMFAGCENLSHVIIPPSVTEIGPCAFAGCKNLQFVEIMPGSGLNSIGAYAFAGCSALSALLFPNTVVKIGVFAFSNCQRLSSLQFEYSKSGRRVTEETFPILLRKIPRAAFAQCRSLKEINFPEGSILNHIERDAFAGCSAMETLRIQSSVHRVGAYAFSHCTKLSHIAMRHIDAIAYLGSGAFKGCVSLEYFQIPAALTVIQAGCFEGCTRLKDIKIPQTVLRVEKRAFARCSALGAVTLNRSITKCAPTAFLGCSPSIIQSDHQERNDDK